MFTLITLLKKLFEEQSSDAGVFIREHIKVLRANNFNKYDETTILSYFEQQQLET